MTTYTIPANAWDLKDYGRSTHTLNGTGIQFDVPPRCQNPGSHHYVFVSTDGPALIAAATVLAAHPLPRDPVIGTLVEGDRIVDTLVGKVYEFHLDRNRWPQLRVVEDGEALSLSDLPEDEEHEAPDGKSVRPTDPAFIALVPVRDAGKVTGYTLILADKNNRHTDHHLTPADFATLLAGIGILLEHPEVTSAGS